MYWSRTGNLSDLLLWLLLTVLWWLGGLLISAFTFRQPRREQLFTGLSIGLLLFILFSNLWGMALPIASAFWAASLSVLVFGGLSAVVARPNIAAALPSRPRLWKFISENWLSGLSFVLLFGLFTLFNRGLALFDDYSNLPLVSSLAASGLPPYFFMDSQIVLDYHYGLHLFAASLVRIGGFFPWSAFDTTRSLTIVLTLLLGSAWFRRLTRQPMLIAAGMLLLCFGTGARWLWLFAPASVTQAASTHIQMWGSALESASDFAGAISQPWKIGGSGPFPFPFAFSNGIFRPLTLALGGNGAIPQLTILLLLLTVNRLAEPLTTSTPNNKTTAWRSHLLASLTIGLLLASLALVADHLLLMLWAGAAVVGLLLITKHLWRLRNRRHRAQTDPSSGQPWLLRGSLLTAICVWLPGLLLAPVMGGVISGMVRHGWTQLAPEADITNAATIGFTGSGLRWPPAIVSAHLGELSLTDPFTLLAALTEMGPVLLLAPWLLGLSLLALWKHSRLQPRQLMFATLNFAALSGLIGPMVFTLNTADRDMSRLTGEALYIWMVLGFSMLLVSGLFISRPDPGRTTRIGWLQRSVALGYVIVVWGGIALLPTQWIAMARPQLTFFVEDVDALYARRYWNQLEPEAMVMGFSYPSRHITVFGRSMGHAFKTYGIPYPEFAALLADPDPISLARAGYLYLYAEKREWQDLTPQQRKAFDHPCVKRLPKPAPGASENRLFFDLRLCADENRTMQQTPWRTSSW